MFKWFHENGMQASQDKCHFVSSVGITTILKLTDCSVENSSFEKLLGVIIDWKLNFNQDVTNLCNKASKKIQALARNFRETSVAQGKILMNAYFLSQFEYCPLVWMNHTRILNCINRLHERALRLVYNNISSAISELLIKETKLTLAFKMFKFKNNLAPKIINNIFSLKLLPYSLRNSTTLQYGIT